MEERQVILNSFGKGLIDVIVAPQILDEGVDVPEADLAIIIATTKTFRQMVQRLGRVLRRKKDGRLARLALLYVEETSEDPDHGAHEDFIDEIEGVADNFANYSSKSSPKVICKFLSDIKPNTPVAIPRMAASAGR